MVMKLKKDDNGNVVIRDDKPVYVMDDGQEFLADVADMYTKTLDLKGERKQLDGKISDLEKRLATYSELLPTDDAESLSKWVGSARDAIEKLKTIDQKKLLDSGKVDEIKEELQAAHDENLANVRKEYDTALSRVNDELSSKKTQIYDLMIGTRFAGSKYFGGEKPLSILPADVALSYFKDNFKVVDDKDGAPKIVGYLDGKEIMSRRPEAVGEPAGFDEALARIIDASPLKDRILAAGPAGSGSGGGSGGIDDGSDFGALQRQYQEASKANNVAAMMALKTRMSELQTG